MDVLDTKKYQLGIKSKEDLLEMKTTVVGSQRVKQSKAQVESESPKLWNAPKAQLYHLLAMW